MHPVLRASLAAIFPAACVGCRRDLSSVRHPSLCSQCRSQLDVPVGWEGVHFHYIDGFHAGGVFDGPYAAAIKRFKYAGRTDLSALIAGQTVRHWDPPEADALVPVPSTVWKELHRGYNPAQMLAEAIALFAGRPVVRGVLRRRFFSPSQARLNRAQRLIAAPKRFELRALPPGLRRVLLVDDVATTGATLEACAQLLKEAGAKTVHAVVAAQDPRRSGADS